MPFSWSRNYFIEKCCITLFLAFLKKKIRYKSLNLKFAIFIQIDFQIKFMETVFEYEYICEGPRSLQSPVVASLSLTSPNSGSRILASPMTAGINLNKNSQLFQQSKSKNIILIIYFGGFFFNQFNVLNVFWVIICTVPRTSLNNDPQKVWQSVSTAFRNLVHLFYLFLQRKKNICECV